ncbi:MAG: hypothetical protein IT293_18025 [Deltaproteobacteria bacterium]|nr:hypothetical protein [Deltaproteobacteria bacterium]
MAEVDPPRRSLAPELVLLVVFVLLAVVAVAVTPELRDAILGSPPRPAEDAGAAVVPAGE